MRFRNENLRIFGENHIPMKRILLLAGLLLAACAPKSDMDKYIDSLMG